MLNGRTVSSDVIADLGRKEGRMEGKNRTENLINSELSAYKQV
jgi:hypothetical protein